MIAYWFNFGEDGAWFWFRYRIKVGCIYRHEWVEIENFENDYLVEHWRECSRCGVFGGYLG